MRKILCTTGTSIAGRPIRQAGQTAPAESLEEYARAIQERINQCRRETASKEEFFTKLSAETNSLWKLKVCPDDEVVLLHTETEDGRLCAEAVQRVLEKEQGVRSRLVKIEGLQVHDAERFRRVGIQNLFQTLQKESEGRVENPEQPVILNATGGFKSVVPYLTLFGLLHRLPVVYIFEWSPTLLRLPPAPINFDYERLAQAEKALSTLQQEGVMPRERFFQMIPNLPPLDRPWYESLLEEDDAGYVTLSAFGSLLASSLQREQSQVYLSSEARQTYSNSDRTQRMVWDMLLSKIGDPLWRKGHRHRFHLSDLEVYKPDRTSYRLAGFLRGNRMYVCLLYAGHQEYERDLPNRRKQEWMNRLNEFTPWYPSPEEKPPATEEELFDRRQQELERTKQELGRTKQDLETSLEELQRTTQELERTQQEFEGAKQELESTKQELARTKQELENSQQELQRTQQELERCNRQLENVKQELERIQHERQEMEAAWRQAEEQVRLLTEANRLLEENVTHTEARLNRLQSEIEQLARELEGWRKRLPDLQRLLAERDRALAWANRPWWRKLLGLPPVSPPKEAQG